MTVRLRRRTWWGRLRRLPGLLWWYWQTTGDLRLAVRASMLTLRVR
jgi:hypothetical protein